MSGIAEETGVTTVVISPWVFIYHCGYVCIGVCGCVWVVVLPILRNHMFEQSEQGAMNFSGFGIS